MIYQRIQGRAESGYKIEGDFRAVDRNDEQFSSFVNYISDFEDKTHPEMYFCHNANLGDGGHAFVIGKNTFEAPREDNGVFTRESQMSHKFIYTDESCDDILNNMSRAAAVDNFYTSMAAYEDKGGTTEEPHYSPFPQGSPEEAGLRYGITERRYNDFVYALCTTAFDTGVRLYITLPDATDEEVGYGKLFMSRLMDNLPMFIKRRFGFVSYFPSNEAMRTRELPVGISCVFTKNSRRNQDNLNACEFYFDNVNGRFFSVELNPAVEDFIRILSDYIFKEDRRYQELFEDIDRLFMDIPDISFDAVVAYYIRSHAEGVGELLWADKLLWLSGAEPLRRILLTESEAYIKNYIFSKDERKLKVIRVLLNVINDEEFQRNIADYVCSVYQDQGWKPGNISNFMADIARPVRDKGGKTHEEKTIARFDVIFNDELYKNPDFTELATREIIFDIDDQTASIQNMEGRTDKILDLVKWYMDKGYTAIEGEYFQRVFFDYIRPIAFNGSNLKTRKQVYDFVSGISIWNVFREVVTDDIRKMLMHIAKDGSCLDQCRAQIKADNSEILTGLIKPFAEADHTGIIQEGIVAKFEYDCLMDELGQNKGDIVWMIHFLKEDRNREMYRKHFRAISEDMIMPRFCSPANMDVTNPHHMNALVEYLLDVKEMNRNGEDLACKLFGRVAEALLLNPAANRSRNPAARISSFIKGFFSNINLQAIVNKGLQKKCRDCLKNMLMDWHKLQSSDLDELAAVAKEYLGVASISGFIDRDYYKENVLRSILEGTIYLELIKSSPQTMVIKYNRAMEARKERNIKPDKKKSGQSNEPRHGKKNQDEGGSGLFKKFTGFTNKFKK